MAMFGPNVLETLAYNLDSVRARNDALAELYVTFPYRTGLGREYALHGYSRRIRMLTHSVERVFSLLPPEQDALPDDNALFDATINIQAFVMNLFGALDNLAWIWVFEKSLTIEKLKVGLGKKCKAVRRSFSPEMRDYLISLEPWFAHIIYFRDALAHRIPLYVPPYCVPDENQVAYVRLDDAKFAADSPEEFDRIKSEQLKLVVYQPVVKHSLKDQKPPVVIHLQLLQDFGTVEEVGRKIMSELKRP